MKDIARQIEQSSRDGDKSPISDLLSALEQAYSDVKPLLRPSYRTSLSNEYSLYKSCQPSRVRPVSVHNMRKLATILTTTFALILLTGCDGPARKLGRGLSNIREPFRLGEMSRAIEQTSLFDGPEQAYTTGVFRGITRTFARTVIGFSEIVTFPIPTPDYDPYFFPNSWFQDPFQKVEVDDFYGLNYPDNYTPGKYHDTITATDTMIGFSGGELVPFIPGSRFRVFER